MQTPQVLFVLVLLFLLVLWGGPQLHPEVMEYVKSIKEKHPNHFTGCRVMEVGSRNINGSVREFFDGVAYIGIDTSPGPGVDWVGLAHEFPGIGEPFDTVISTECFEHDPHLNLTVRKMIDLLRPGGLFVATWASINRQEHGTTRTEAEGSPLFGPDPDYYRGVSWADFNIVQQNRLRDVAFIFARHDLDCYVSGFKKDN